MTKTNVIEAYASGDRTCPICEAALPAHETWHGARYGFCGSSDCSTAVKSLEGGRYVSAGEHLCESADCDNFIPEGRYDLSPAFLTCSSDCYQKRNQGKRLLRCDCGCGSQFYRKRVRTKKAGLVFVSPKHQGQYKMNQFLNESCGRFRDIADEYLNGFAAFHYRDQGHVRCSLGRLFRFLNEIEMSSLDGVTSRTITDFLTWAHQSGVGFSTDAISCVSVFFKWMIADGRRQSANPVIGMMHNRQKRHRMPRPLSDSESAFAWALLCERGNTRLRLATAIAQEAGLRIGEICRLRIQDVDIVGKRFFVRLPNKTSRERWALFSDDTVRCLQEWMVERNPDKGHDGLLHNTFGTPCLPSVLANEFNRVLCKTYKGKVINEVGFDSWSTHRLRHTMASNLVKAGADAATVMAAGGWVTYESMAGYAQVDMDLARRGYEDAMRRAHEQKVAEPQREVLSPADLLRRRHIRAVKHRLSEEIERCV